MSKNSHLKLVCFASVSSVLFLSSCGPWCQKNPSFCVSLFCAFSVFLLALVSINCLFCALSVFLWALVSKNSHLKLVCFVSVSSVLFLSSCGPWCQKTLILSWFALFLSLLCSFCLLVGLGVKKLPSFCVCLFCASSVFLLALVSINCLFCARSVFLWALVSKNSS